MKRLIFIVFLIPGLLIAQHTIKGVFTPAKEYNIALLYKVTPIISEYVANAEIQPDGSFEFKLDSTITKGVFRLVYAVPQEDYNFDILYNAKEDIELSFNSETGVSYSQSVENKLLSSYTTSMSMVTQSIGNYFRQNSGDTLALSSIFKTQKETQLSYEEAAEGTIALEFIKANKPFTPKKALDVKSYVSQLKKHYFDHVDFNNSILQSSSFLDEKMLNYVFGMTTKSLDDTENYKANIDVVCNEMKDAPNEVKRILLYDLWQQMVDLKIESVANYISEKYLMDIAVALNDQELLHTLILYKDLSNGSEAPDFALGHQEQKNIDGKNLLDINLAKTYVLVFWSTGCSHCLDEVPQLQEFMKSKNEIKVIAVALEDEPSKWNELSETYSEFIHVYGEGKWDNKIGDDYGITSTPTYFVLNKNKEIIAKPENFEGVQAFFEDSKKEE
ncbi:TlpA disulfide reductase family protein [uncultured Algibacter sp.]|uniref:TlpA family protein disulfide reductase n=1 Tax=uncultured Algibacter sp. TaxID=298659 RepID=UPI00261620E7|nr:TlpA disulfide reductase family protein [uncultured Algibacter sp.]